MSQRSKCGSVSRLFPAIAFALLLMPIAAMAQSPGQIFADVATGTALYDATSIIYQLNITNGCSSPPLDFCPTLPLTREDMAALVVRAWSIGIWNDPEAFQTNAPITSTQYFTDVRPIDHNYVYIEKLFELGITSGYAPGVFCPNTGDNGFGLCPSSGGTLVNYQIAVFVARIRALIDNQCHYATGTGTTCSPNSFSYTMPVGTTTNQYFSDVPPTDPYFKYIQRMGDLNAYANVYSPAPYPNCPSCTFNESGTVTRGPMAIELVTAAGLDPRVTLTFNSTVGPPSGPNYTTTLPTITVPFNYYFQDKALGQADVNYAQFALVDAGGAYLCVGQWGRPNAFWLQDGGSVEFGIPSAPEGDSFCTVSLVSITDSTSDPSAVTVLLNFTFNPGFAGTYTVMSQMNYATGYGTPAFENVGTVTIQTPPAQSPGPTVTLTDTTQSSSYFFVGDHFSLTVMGPSAPSGSPVSVSINGIDYGVVNYLSSGVYTITDHWTNPGTYTEVWYVNGVPAGTLQFSVVLPATATLVNASFPGSPLFEVGQSYMYQITGPPGLAVVLNSSQNGNLAQTTFGQTNASGVYQYSGTWATSDVGDWNDVWVVGSLQTFGQLTFSVGLTGCN